MIPYRLLKTDEQVLKNFLPAHTIESNNGDIGLRKRAKAKRNDVLFRKSLASLVIPVNNGSIRSSGLLDTYGQSRTDHSFSTAARLSDNGAMQLAVLMAIIVAVGSGK